MEKRKKYFERKYLLAVDDLILVAYEIEQALDNYRETLNHSNVDIKLELMSLKLSKLWMKILNSKFEMEFDIILYNVNEKRFRNELRKLFFQTHSTLIYVVHFLSTRTSKKLLLDCQISDNQEETTIIHCGIGHAQALIRCKI